MATKRTRYILCYWDMTSGFIHHKRAFYDAPADIAQEYASMFFRVLVGHALDTVEHKMYCEWKEHDTFNVSIESKGKRLTLYTGYLSPEAEHLEFKAQSEAGKDTPPGKWCLTDAQASIGHGVPLIEIEERIAAEYEDWVVMEYYRRKTTENTENSDIDALKKDDLPLV